MKHQYRTRLDGKVITRHNTAAYPYRQALSRIEIAAKRGLPQPDISIEYFVNSSLRWATVWRAGDTSKTGML